MAREPKAPATIGRYEVERLLGQGGMGRVWLARDTVLGRQVAIKVLRDDLSLAPRVHDELVARMGHEARAAAAVSHPNIVILHDMGEDDAVGLFLVFEYVTTKGEDGEGDVVLSLRDRLKRGPLSLAEVARLAREVGSALTFAHRAGVIHRDVKPENILFSRTGFKIADFGIARIPDSTITRTNTVLGTPAYTAPEALSAGEFSPASDQFSLAATLYEAATATRAFAGADAIDTAGKVSSDAPPPIDAVLGSEAAVRTLEEALQRGLAKEPERRFSSCTELGEAVARATGAPAIDTGARPSLRPPPIIVPGRTVIEIERTPLSSRLAHAERIERAQRALPAYGETPRPSASFRQRSQTHRFQNIAAGLALLVLAVLVLVGKRSPDRAAAAAASASVAAELPPPAARAVAKARPRATATARAPDPGAVGPEADGGASNPPDTAEDE